MEVRITRQEIIHRKGKWTHFNAMVYGLSCVEMDPLILLIHLVLRDGSKKGLRFLTIHVDYVE